MGPARYPLEPTTAPTSPSARSGNSWNRATSSASPPPSWSWCSRKATAQQSSKT